MNEGTAYAGDDLELFQNARNWKRYLRRQIARFLGRRVLEVGAGIGGTTTELCVSDTDQWVCLEPDPTLAQRLEKKITDGLLPSACTVRTGDLKALAADDRFDSILYIDVLEHIEDDRAELSRAAEKLSTDGFLIVLAPAHQWAFSPLDEAHGHFRRYTGSSLAKIKPRGFSPVFLRYLDSVGLLASLSNKLIIRAALPSPGQIALWDRLMVPISRVIDPVFGYRLGKSILAVWKKDDRGPDQP